MCLLSHARIACVREKILETPQISIQANNYQMVMAFHTDLKANMSGNWKQHVHDMTMNLIDAERTRIQNLMIGGFLFKDAVKEEARNAVENDIQILEKETR